MARKESRPAPEHRGLSDIIGIVLIAASLLVIGAQASFDPNDLASNRVPPNAATHNLIGGVGAFGANLMFQLFGGGAIVLPILLLIFGVSYLFEFFAYLKRRWLWATILFLTCVGLLDLYSDVQLLDNLRSNIKAVSAGGYLGKFMNDVVFGHF